MKKLTFERIFWIAVAIVLVILLMRKCDGKKEDKPNIATPEQIAKPVIINEGLSLLQEDSIINIADDLRYQLKESQQTAEALQQINVAIQKDMDDYISIQLPDTCKEYQLKMIALNKKLAESAAKKDAACKTTINNLNKISEQKDALIALGKKDYKLLRTSFDTCLNNLGKSIKQSKPDRIVSFGAAVISDYNNLNKAAVAVTIDYMNRKGTSFGASVFNTKQVQLTFKKKLFSL